MKNPKINIETLSDFLTQFLSKKKNLGIINQDEFNKIHGSLFALVYMFAISYILLIVKQRKEESIKEIKSIYAYIHASFVISLDSERAKILFDEFMQLINNEVKNNEQETKSEKE